MQTHRLQDDFKKITEAKHHDPFATLGKHSMDNEIAVRVYLPHATEVSLAEGNQPMKQIGNTGIFEWRGNQFSESPYYELKWRDSNNREHVIHDPYSFPAQLSDYDLHLFSEGTHHNAYRFLGSHPHQIDDVFGVLFAVWAPNAERVSVIGDFNRWDGRCHPMRVHGNSGVWEIFIPDIEPNALYKYEIRNRQTGEILQKTDPYGQRFEQRPKTASIVPTPPTYRWNDREWLQRRGEWNWQNSPISIYEVHLGSWQRGPEGEFLNYQELAQRLVAYVTEMGFSHIELLPITEHPYDPSWGYQTTGYFAPTSRYGKPDELRYFIDHCHQHDIGVILDWVPAHFPKDAHGLAKFDGSAIYEHEDPRRGEHLDWDTLIYNYGRNEVKSFLLSSAFFWVEEFHIDGLRVDAVASMLYLDYSRDEWLPNQYGGRENLEAVEFIQGLNISIHGAYPGTLMFAEESTAWPQVSRPVHEGGLGFDIKWNMGWMNDTLRYIENEPVHRKYQHNLLTFSILYAFTENFLLPFSHDEVVHGKQSMLHKMPGDEWQKFANLRVLYTYMFTHPGKKLMFMGTEFGQGQEWASNQTLDWYVLDFEYHIGIKKLVKDLNNLYRTTPALYYHDFEWQGFDWVDCHDANNSILSFIRRNNDEFVLIVVNLTPVPRLNFRVGVPQLASYKEIFNSDSVYYGGSNVGNGDHFLQAETIPWNDKPYSISINLPPLAGLVISPLNDWCQSINEDLG